MSKILYPANSPYSASGQTNWYMGRYIHRSIPPSGDDEEFTITAKYQYRPDKLSNDKYGTPVYWWVFAVRNRNELKDPVWDMEIGTVIQIPSFPHVKKATGT